MNKQDSVMISARIVAETRDIVDERDKVKVGAKILRRLVNQLLDIPDDTDSEIIKLRAQIDELNKKLLEAEQSITKRAVRNVELLRENLSLRGKDECRKA